MQRLTCDAPALVCAAQGKCSGLGLPRGCAAAFAGRGKVPFEFHGDKGTDIKKAQSEFVFSAQLLFTSPVSKLGKTQKFCCVLFQLRLGGSGLQRALRTELVELKCFPSHLLCAQQCLHSPIIFCQGKLGCGENKNITCEMCAVKPPALLALRSSRKFSWGGCAAQVKAH